MRNKIIHFAAHVSKKERWTNFFPMFQEASGYKHENSIMDYHKTSCNLPKMPETDEKSIAEVVQGLQISQYNAIF